MSAAYTVGDKVWVYDVNRRQGPAEGTVVKVGRTLVHVDYGYGARTFRIEDGARNDNYAHQWVLTLDERIARDERNALLSRLQEEAGVSFWHGGFVNVLDAQP